MLTAAEARVQSKANYAKEVEMQLAQINDRIIDAVARCDTSISISDIHARTEQYLQELGYTVERYTSPIKETTVTISWNE